MVHHSLSRDRLPVVPSDPASRTVLLVDGDAASGGLAGELLRSHPAPLEPILAESGEAALRILESGQRIDYLLTDLALPDMDGIRLLIAARQSRPGLAMAAMTGAPSEPAQREAFEGGALQLLAKPLDLEGLVAGLFSDLPGIVVHLEGTLDLLDICQLSAACQSSAGVRLHDPAGTATLVHRGGTVIHAAAGELFGREAFGDLLGRTQLLFDTVSDFSSHVSVNCEVSVAEAERRPATRAAGSLRHLTLRHLLEWAITNRLTGDLTVASEGRTGVLSFERGRIRGATTLESDGSRAAAEILTWRRLRVAVSRSLDEGDAAFEDSLSPLIERFASGIDGFQGTGVVRLSSRQSAGSRITAGHLESLSVTEALSQVVESHLAAVRMLGGGGVWGETEDILVTMSNSFLLLRLLGGRYYHWLAVSRDANLAMCRLAMQKFDAVVMAELVGLEGS